MPTTDGPLPGILLGAVLLPIAVAFATRFAAALLPARAARSRGAVAALGLSAAFVAALTFVGLLVGAQSYLDSGDAVRFPVESGVLLAFAAACVALRRPWLATAFSALLAAAAACLASRHGTPGVYVD